MDIEAYEHIHTGGAGFIELPRGLVAVSGGEAVQFLDGMITNDVKTLGDGQQMSAAFPNAQGRLLGLVRIFRDGERFLIETEAATSEKIFQNLFRFTFAGDFKAEDLSGEYSYFELLGDDAIASEGPAGTICFSGLRSTGCFVPKAQAGAFREKLVQSGAKSVDEETYDVLRIENGVPRYGVDMDENTIVPELGLEGLISYTKGCYVGQEIIARIHFRGRVAKQLMGIVVDDGTSDELASTTDLTSADGKGAGRVTSVTYSPAFKRTIALAYVRNDFLEPGTDLLAGSTPVTVKSLPIAV